MKPGQNERYRLKCLYDPTEGAPFRGNFFSWTEVKELLSYAYLPPGSMWSWRGKTHRVEGELSFSEYRAAIPQRLVACDGP